MPTYTFRCVNKECDNVFELWMSMKETHEPKCEKCHSKSEREIEGGSGIVFKGSGFYSTDYSNRSLSVDEKKAVDTYKKDV